MAPGGAPLYTARMSDIMVTGYHEQPDGEIELTGFVRRIFRRVRLPAGGWDRAEALHRPERFGGRVVE